MLGIILRYVSIAGWLASHVGLTAPQYKGIWDAVDGGGVNLFCGGGTNAEYCRAWEGQFSQVLRGELEEINVALYRNTSLWLSPPPKNQTL